MKLTALLALSAAGLVGFAASARADDLSFGWTLGDAHGDRGFFAYRHEDSRVAARPERGGDFYRYQPQFGRDRRFEDLAQRFTYIPGHEEVREQRICEPAVYEERVVPVYEDRQVPVFELRFDLRARHPVNVQVGFRIERVRIGERIERVLVREATCRVVQRIEWVPGRYVEVAAARDFRYAAPVARVEEPRREDRRDDRRADRREDRRDDRPERRDRPVR